MSAQTSEPPLPRYGDPVWCVPCVRAIGSVVRSLPQDLALLRLEWEHGSAPQRERVSGTQARPIHPKESFTFLAAEICEVLVGWEEDVREQRRFSQRRVRGTHERQAQEAARFLLSHLEWLMTDHPSDEAIEAFGREILDLHRQVRRATKSDDAPLQKCQGIRCPKCLMKALVWEQDYDKSLTGYVLCQGCQNLLTREEYDAWVSREARGAKKLVRRA